MRTLVVGPGAIGCLLASKFCRFSDNIYLLDKNKERADRLKNDGIEVENLSGEKSVLKVNVLCDIKKAPQFDLIIIATKSYDTHQAVESIKEIAENCSVLTLQNGLNNVNTICNVLGRKSNIFAGTTSCGAINLSWGKIRHTGDGETIIAPLKKKDLPVARKISDFFNRCQITTHIGESVDSIVWSKLLINVGINAIASILQVRNGVLLEIPFALSVMKKAIEEGESIVKAKGIKLMYPSAYIRAKEICKKTSSNINSMLQDILSQKRTEIDYLQGAIIKEGKKYKINTPVNEVLYYLVKTIENKKQKNHSLC